MSSRTSKDISSNTNGKTVRAVSRIYLVLIALLRRDNNVSHISSGYWYNSAAQGKVRVDETFEGSLASSLFDYTNITAEGRILNKLWEIHPSVGSTPTCFVEHLQNPAFPLVTVDLLKVNQAIFGGVVNDPLVGYTQSVSHFK